LRRDLANAPNNILRHHRRGLRIDHHHRLIANDNAGVRVALGRVGIGVLGELVEGDLLLLEVGLGREFLFAHDARSWLGGAVTSTRNSTLSAMNGSHLLCQQGRYPGLFNDRTALAMRRARVSGFFAPSTPSTCSRL